MGSSGRKFFGGYGPIALIVNVLAVLWVALAGMSAAARAAEPVRILAFGDSLTAGYNLPHDAAFPVQLEEALRARGHDVRVVNGGVSGDTTAGGLARLEWALADGVPDITILELGANDALRGLDPAQAQANLASIIDTLRDRGSRVLLAGMMAPPNMGADYAEAFDAIFPALAERTGVTLYPFFLDGVAARPEVLQGDGMHPTAQGVAVIVQHILPAVEALLDEVRPATDTPATEDGE